jgi:hypothetical protein
MSTAPKKLKSSKGEAQPLPASDRSVERALNKLDRRLEKFDDRLSSLEREISALRVWGSILSFLIPSLLLSLLVHQLTK